MGFSLPISSIPLLCPPARSQFCGLPRSCCFPNSSTVGSRFQSIIPLNYPRPEYLIFDEDFDGWWFAEGKDAVPPQSPSNFEGYGFFYMAWNLLCLTSSALFDATIKRATLLPPHIVKPETSTVSSASKNAISPLSNSNSPDGPSIQLMEIRAVPKKGGPILAFLDKDKRKVNRYAKVQNTKTVDTKRQNEVEIFENGRSTTYATKVLGLLNKKCHDKVVIKAMGSHMKKASAVADLVKGVRGGLSIDIDYGVIEISDIWEPLDDDYYPLETVQEVDFLSITLSKDCTSLSHSVPFYYSSSLDTCGPYSNQNQLVYWTGYPRPEFFIFQEDLDIWWYAEDGEAYILQDTTNLKVSGAFVDLWKLIIAISSSSNDIFKSMIKETSSLISKVAGPVKQSSALFDILWEGDTSMIISLLSKDSASASAGESLIVVGRTKTKRFTEVLDANRDKVNLENEVEVFSKGCRTSYVTQVMSLLNEQGFEQVIIKGVGDNGRMARKVAYLVKKAHGQLWEVSKCNTIEVSRAWKLSDDDISPFKMIQKVELVTISLSKTFPSESTKLGES